MEFVKNLQSFLQSYNKSLINQACSGPYWENIGPRSFLYGPRCARSVLSRSTRADILPVQPSRLVNKIYIYVSIPTNITVSIALLYLPLPLTGRNCVFPFIVKVAEMHRHLFLLRIRTTETRKSIFLRYVRVSVTFPERK